MVHRLPGLDEPILPFRINGRIKLSKAVGLVGWEDGRCLEQHGQAGLGLRQLSLAGSTPSVEGPCPGQMVSPRKCLMEPFETRDLTTGENCPS